MADIAISKEITITIEGGDARSTRLLTRLIKRGIEGFVKKITVEGIVDEFNRADSNKAAGYTVKITDGR